MKHGLIAKIETYIRTLLQSQGNEIFDLLLEKFKTYYDRPAHSLQEIKDKLNTKVKGDILEHFALRYFIVCKKWENTWLLEDVPQEHLDKLHLKRRDMGIDLISIDSQGRYYAIQVKYRKRNPYKSRTGLSWKQLSTFYALATRSGPYHKHIVFTNADFVRHVGKKTEKDWSICIGTLRRIPKHQWCALAGEDAHKDVVTKDVITTKLSITELREARLKALENR